MTLRIETMSIADLERALGWAAAEGWNPGLDDAAAFHAADAGGFLMGWLGTEPVCCISVVRYSDDFGFLGLYLCRPDRRGQGHGWAVWQAGLALLGSRTVGLDGVVAQQENYGRSGFRVAYRNIRMAGTLPEPGRGTTVAVQPEHLPTMLALDRAASGVVRDRYLTGWFRDTDTRKSRVMLDGDRLLGFGTIRRCRTGCKIGPVFAVAADIAHELLAALCAEFPGQPASVDVPEPNGAFLDDLGRAGFSPVFETARMYKGSKPEARLDLVFGQVNLELG